MEFKIDTKPTYTVFTPSSIILDANLTAAIRQKWKELTESGSYNLIIDLQHCLNTDETDMLIQLHEEVYSVNQSIVFANPQQNLLAALKQNEADLLINIVPTMAEAIDIISMEILERELFDEKS